MARVQAEEPLRHLMYKFPHHFFAFSLKNRAVSIGLGLLLMLVPTAADAKPRSKAFSAKASKARASKTRSTKVGKKIRANHSRRRAKRHHTRTTKIKHRGQFTGHGVQKESLRQQPVPKPSGDIWVWSPNHREELKVNIYEKDGSFNQESLAKLDNAFRCKRTGEIRAVDPRLYEILSTIQDHFGGKRVELTSGFRFQKNEGSRHFHASAMDVRVEGVSMRELYGFADSLDRGGMGIGKYPKSQFVHIDFRAPGEPSYRWTDNSKAGRGASGRQPSKHWRKPNS